MKPVNPDGIGPRRPAKQPTPKKPTVKLEPTVAEQTTEFKPAAKSTPKRRFWTKRRVIRWVVRLLLVSAVAGVALTNLRYKVLGLVLRAQAQVTVVDSKSGQPIDAATVDFDGHSAKTGKDGIANVSGVPLGKRKLTVSKPGYQEFGDTVAVYFGHNQFGPVKVLAVGVPIVFKVTDSIGNQPLEGVSVSIGDVTEQTASDGSVTLNVDPGSMTTAQISAQGYAAQTKTVDLTPGAPANTLKLVPSAKHYFLSNRSGKIDLYQSSVDGSDQTVVLAGTGKESSSTSLAESRDGRWVALLSSRDGLRTNSGSPLLVLYILDTQTKNLVKVSQLSGLTVIGWIDSYLVYTSQSYNPSVGRLAIYNAANLQDQQVAQSGNVTSAIVIDNRVYYALSSGAADLTDTGVYTVRSDGGDKKKLYSASASFSRTAKNILTLNGYTQNEWLTYDIAASKLQKLPGQPPAIEDHNLAMSDTGAFGVEVLNRDGRNELYTTDANGQNEKRLTTIGSVRFVERWLGDTYVIFRVQSSDQTADYIVNIKGGDAVKINDTYSDSSGT